MNTESLERAGLTKTEASVYLTLLRLGTTSTGKVIKQGEVSRSKVYDVLERLKRRGLVTEVTKNNVKYFEATNPERIIDYLNAKKDEIDGSINETKKILPELKKYRNLHLEKQEARVYTGIEGWKTVYNEILASLGRGDEYIAFGLGKMEAETIFVSDFIRKFHVRRAEKGATARVLLREEARKGVENNFPKRIKGAELRYTDTKNPTNITIWGDNVLTLVWGENPVAFVIQSKQVAKKYREYFEYAWKTAKP